VTPVVGVTAPVGGVFVLVYSTRTGETIRGADGQRCVVRIPGHHSAAAPEEGVLGCAWTEGVNITKKIIL